MNQERLLDVIKAPHVSEKSTVIAERDNQIVIKVAVDATKREIKSAVEALFDVKVKKVTTLRQAGKVKRFRGVQGKRAEYKKATVTLAEGSAIDVTTGV